MQKLRRPTAAALEPNGQVVTLPSGTSREELSDFVLAQLVDEHFEGEPEPGQEPVAAVYERLYGLRSNGPGGEL